MNPREQQTEDLKAFEYRLTETVTHVHGTTRKWRILVAVLMVWLMFSLWCWWTTETRYLTLWEMVKDQYSLVLCVSVLLSLTLVGMCERARASKIITARCRNVLKDYNMSCDEKGKLILKRTPRQPLVYGDSDHT